MDTNDNADTTDTADTPDEAPACGDERAIFAECRARHATGDEISDACARAIAALWHGGQRSRAHAFASTGAILSDADPATDTPDDIRYHDDNAPSLLWREIFLATTNDNDTRCTQYEALDADWQLAADMFGTYLTHCTARGPQPGWSALWPRP
jgi:hypothetical protein